MLKRLLDRLHRIFDKEPHTVEGVAIASPVALTVIVRDYAVTVSAAGYETVIISGETTLDEMATAIETAYGATVTVNPILQSRKWDPVQRTFDATPTAMVACWLREGTYSGTGISIPYPTAVLYNEMQLYARLLTEQAARVKDAGDQVYMLRSSGAWTDYWARDHFGIMRFTGESDAAYCQRAIHELLRPTQNNKALEAIVFEAMGIRCYVRDAKPVTGLADDAGRILLDISVDNTLSADDAQILIDRVEDIIRRYKAAGTDFATAAIKTNSPVEQVAVGEVLAAIVTALLVEDAYVPAKLKVGAGWKCGTPGLKVGVNSGLVEQVFVQTIQVSDMTVVERALYGG